MLQSMTGFARTAGSDDSGRWTWELRSVNGKSLDVRQRLAFGFEELEQPVRQLFQQRFSRGNIQCSLVFEATSGERVAVVNRNLVSEIISVSREISQTHPDIQPVTMDGLMAVRGVVELEEGKLDDDAISSRNKKVMESLDQALDQLENARREEGQKISKVLSVQIDEIERHVHKVENDPSRSAEAIREKLKTRLAELLDEDRSLEDDRLYQEAAMLAMKSDLAEEIDRLHSHVDQARQLVSSGAPVGRKLDFLSQEFNRECNTICSKSNAAEVTRAGLEMKVVIDRFREQIQNIE